MKILVTGAAGFIGAHCVLRLMRDGHAVVGLDNFNGYYDPQLKHDRVRWVRDQVGHFPLARIDLADAAAIEALFVREQPQVVINLAAQAGVRYSLENPNAYIDSNILGFMNVWNAVATTRSATWCMPAQFCLWHEWCDTLFGARQRRSPALAVRREQESQ